MGVSDMLSADQVAAMLTGSYVAPRASESVLERTRVYKPRYDSCDGCKANVPCLITFRGRLDWSPELADNHPLRAAIEDLRSVVGSRTILLCGPCITRMSKDRETSPTTDGRLPIVFN